MPATPTPEQEHNLLIEASAGTGKTHHLVGRFLRLLLAFRKPDQIIALTFTRKAAGEFFDRILGALATAADSDEGAEKAARDFKVDGLTRESAMELLRLATESLHRLSLGTLDSFFSRVLRSFPGEFGISGDFDIMDEAAESESRRQVLDEILSDIDDADAFLGAFRQATFGAEEKRLLSNLEDFVSDYHRLLIACPQRDRWAKAQAIWPEQPWWMTRKFDLDEILKGLRDGLPAIEDQHKSAAKGFEKFIEELPFFTGGATGRSLKGVIEKTLPILEELHEGRETTLAYYKKGGLQLDPGLCRSLADAMGFIVQREMVSKLQQTGGIYDIVRRYESGYHRRVRRSGRLSFDDILILLAGAAPDDTSDESVPALSMLDDKPDAAGRRMQIDYRLDGLFHHWLIDEFQDTSRRQWKVLDNLIEEVIEDDSGDRTFYYVGDEKQAIYGWRGGDSRLFQEIRRRYSEPPRPEDRWIREEHLDVSWRSGPVLLDAVNEVFGNFDGLAALLGPEHAPVIRDRWENTNAGSHKASPLTESSPGYFRFVTVEGATEDGDLDDQEAQWQVVLETLKELAPVENGLSVAVLMRRGRPAAALADYIRQDGQIPVMVDGKMPVGTDHPIATSFRALLKFTAHPGDTAAWEHLVMTPALRSLDYESLGKARFELTAEIQDRIQDRGFGSAFQAWVSRLEAGLDDPMDDFSQRRIAQLVEACRRFDLKGSRSIGEFLRYLDSYSASDTPSAGVVQIMTIHKAKGLTFDAVVVADLKPNAITELRELEAIKGYDGARQLQWLITSPRKELAKAIEPLKSAYLEAEMDTALEELCAIYVALTRARYANYVILSKLPTNRESTAPRNLLARQFEATGFEPASGILGEVEMTTRYESGNPDWISEVLKDGEAKEAETRDSDHPRNPVTTRRRFPLRKRRIPSNASDQRSWGGAAQLFVPESASATGLGSAVHALFEEIEWVESGGVKAHQRRWKEILSRYPEHRKEALIQAQASLGDREILSRFEAGTYRSPLVWREKRFELITPQGEWISGVFDRVVLERDETGSFLAGHIIDFKTNQVSTDEQIIEATEHYRPQMKVYREALGRLTGLPLETIGAELIFTRPVEVRNVFPISPPPRSPLSQRCD